MLFISSVKMLARNDANKKLLVEVGTLELLVAIYFKVLARNDAKKKLLVEMGTLELLIAIYFSC